MKVVHVFILVISTALAVQAQLGSVTFAAGSPEDMALTEIATVTELEQKIELYEKFVKDFNSNPEAVAYGNAELADLYLAQGDKEKALAAADRAAAAAPDTLNILVSAARVAQQEQDTERSVRYAAQGGKAYNSISADKPPEGRDPEIWKSQVQEVKDRLESSYHYLETIAFNAIAGTDDPKKRMEYIEAFSLSFPDSRFQAQVSQYALYTISQLQDPDRAISYGEKVLEANPDSVPALLLLAETYGENPKKKDLAKAEEYARRAVEAVGEPEGGNAEMLLLAGSAHASLGSALLNQGKTEAAIPELEKAAEQLKGQETPYAAALYKLGFAYAKLRRTAEARKVLSEAAKIEGPVQPLARDLLNKIR